LIRLTGLLNVYLVAGVDGCRGGWVAAFLEARRGRPARLEWSVFPRFAELLEREPRPRLIAVDMPVGLPSEPRSGGRECDREARRLLGRRRASIFTPPPRPLLAAAAYDEVRGAGLSRQSFNIGTKIRELDALLTPRLQKRVRESHPELGFLALRGRPMAHPKRTAAARGGA
jgi:threonine dehydratase